jgi:hypothetical protein
MGHRRFKLTAQGAALTMNSASALSIRSIVDNCNASTSQPFFRTWKLDLNFPPSPVPFDQFDGLQASTPAGLSAVRTGFLG